MFRYGNANSNKQEDACALVSENNDRGRERQDQRRQSRLAGPPAPSALGDTRLVTGHWSAEPPAFMPRLHAG